MAKPKGKKDSAGGVNRHLRARLEYLHNAATFLQSQSQSQPTPSSSQPPSSENPPGALSNPSTSTTRIIPQVTPTTPQDKPESSTNPLPHTRDSSHLPQLSRAYISQMRGVSLKSQLRLPVDVKRTFCKRCDTILVSGVNCVHETRNPSRGGRKPWAGVRVVRCTVCDTEKRFPLAQKRSLRLSERRKQGQVDGDQGAG